MLTLLNEWWQHYLAFAYVPEHKFYVWVCAIALLMTYIVIDNWDGLAHDKWPDDEPPEPPAY